MPTVRPFCAARPAKGLAEKVAALPFDVYSSTEAREIAKDNPYSFLHVDKAEIDLDPAVGLYDAAVYEKAAENLEKFVAKGTLIKDGEPYFYIYRLTMDGRAQTGLVACASIDEYLDGTIKKHELTLEAKELDRIRHIEATNANTGPIFLAYRDKHEIDALIKGWISSHAPVYDFTAGDGVGHAVWVIDDKGVIDKIRHMFKTVDSFYIADGHHRNASAVKVGLKKREGRGDYDINAEYNYYLTVIFPDSQLKIMDYNRAIKTLNGFTERDFLKKAGEAFNVEKIGETAFRPDKALTFGMYMGGVWYKLTAKDGSVDLTDPVKSLDVSVLQENLLAPVLGISDPRTDKNIEFIGGARGLGELERLVNSGVMKVAFAMFPTSIGQLFSVADAGLLMPPKSTWFEPKLRSGLFIHYLD